MVNNMKTRHVFVQVYAEAKCVGYIRIFLCQQRCPFRAMAGTRHRERFRVRIDSSLAFYVQIWRSV